MKELLQKVSPELKSFGYKKKGNDFWKIENDIYRVINFQQGLHGGGYFFINVCIHPCGIPHLYPNQLLVEDKPKESHCIIRQRIEQIIVSNEMNSFKEGLVSIEDERATENFIRIIPDIENWSLQYGTYGGLISKNEKELNNLLNVSPILKRKALALLQVYCEIKLSNKKRAIKALEDFKKEVVNGLNFCKIEHYLVSLIDKLDEH